jgi:hypothetical protein
MGKAIRVSAMVLLLACSASAGIMQYDVAPPPPPPPVQSDGIMQYDLAPPTEGTTEGQTEPPLLVQIALNLLTLL